MSPKSLPDYRVVNLTKRKIYQVEHLLLRITYNDIEEQKHCDITIYRDWIETKSSKYENIIDLVTEIKSRLEKL